MEDFLRESPFEDPSKTDAENRQYRPDYEGSTALGDFDFAMAQTLPAQNLDSGLPQYDGDSGTGMPANDPYFEAFDFLGSPSQQPVSPNMGANNLNPQDLGLDAAFGDSLQFNINSADPANNLDQLISPDNGGGANILASAQYFSPNTRTDNFGGFGGVADNQLSKSFSNNSLSPPGKQESYLSPNAFLSPQSNAYDGSFDTLKSPYSGSYLNSPPPLALTQSTSIPNAANFTQTSISNALSSPQSYSSYGLGMSAPSASGDQVRKAAVDPAGSKNLTQEEKVKRRREFHNAVERRRRDLIKEKIKELGLLVPPSLLTPQVCAVQTLQKQPHSASAEIKELLASVKVKETKPNKATILSTSVDYIRHLQYVLETQDRKREEIEAQISQLEQEATRGPSSSRQDAFGAPTSEFNPDDFFADVVPESAQF